MKRICSLIAAAAFAAVSLTGFATPLKFGAVNFKLSTIQQSVANQITVSTNTTSSSTNITQTALYKTQTTTINNNQLLVMLANSFNTTWPAGAVLKMDNFGDFDVVDGTNLVEDVSEVLSVSGSTNDVYSGTIVDNATINRSGVNESETIKYVGTASVSLVYDDSFLTTANGTNTQITVNGIETTHGITSASISSETAKYVYSFIGTGTGSLTSVGSTNQLIIGGTFTAVKSGP